MSGGEPARRVEVAIFDGPLEVRAAGPAGNDAGEGAVGARLSFEGVVRLDEGGRRLAALAYETYDPMAERMLRVLAEDVAERFGLERLCVRHSRGRVPVGACSLQVVIESGHRGQGLDAMRVFIERLKQDVPIWKSPVWDDRSPDAGDSPAPERS